MDPPVKPKGSRVYSVRATDELAERFEKLKREQAHQAIPPTKLLLEALRLYVELGEAYGLDQDLRVNLPPQSEKSARRHSRST